MYRAMHSSGGHLWAWMLDDQVHNEITRFFAYDWFALDYWGPADMTYKLQREGMFSRGMSAINRNDWSSNDHKNKTNYIVGNKVEFLVDIATTTMFHIWLCHRKILGAKSWYTDTGICLAIPESYQFAHDLEWTRSWWIVRTLGSDACV